MDVSSWEASEGNSFACMEVINVEDELIMVVYVRALGIGSDSIVGIIGGTEDVLEDYYHEFVDWETQDTLILDRDEAEKLFHSLKRFLGVSK